MVRKQTQSLHLLNGVAVLLKLSIPIIVQSIKFSILLRGARSVKIQVMGGGGGGGANINLRGYSI